jgi:hypothetical protein
MRDGLEYQNTFYDKYPPPPPPPNKSFIYEIIWKDIVEPDWPQMAI